MKSISYVVCVMIILLLAINPLFAANTANKTGKKTVTKVNKKKAKGVKVLCRKVGVDFKDLPIIDLIKYASKLMGKNILLTQNISGKVDFVQAKRVCESEVVDILINVLDTRGYTLVGDGNTLSIVRSTDAIKSSLPIYYQGGVPKDEKQMVTEFIDIKRENVDVVSAKVRHLASKYSKIVTNSNTNTLIITDYPTSIKTIKKAIRILARDKDRDMRIIPIENMRLSTIYNDIRKIINAFYTTTVVPNRIEIIQNNEINSLVLIGKKKQLDRLEEYIKDVDQRAVIPKPDDVVEVIYLKNAESKNILGTINNLIAKRTASNKTRSKPYISSDNESNSLVLIGPKEELSLIKSLISTLDKEKQQVYVRVQIIEISKKMTDEIGAKYGIEGGQVTSNGLLTFAMNLGGKATASNIVSMAGVDKNIKQGIILGAAIDFFVQNSFAKVVSEPSITSINNKESSIQVGETRSILTGTSTASGTTTTSYKREDIGLNLKIKPRISNDNKVTLNITAKLEDVAPGGAANTPNTTKREVKTTAIVKNGESVIVGGLVRRKETDATVGLPYLSAIPLLGTLFGGDTETVDNVNFSHHYDPLYYSYQFRSLCTKRGFSRT